MRYFIGLGYELTENYAKAKEWFNKVCDHGWQLGCDKYRELTTWGFLVFSSNGYLYRDDK
jgi:hypothetical protein